MSIDGSIVAATSAQDGGFRLRTIFGHWPILAGLLIIGIPTFARLGQEVWSTELGTHGPIVLATGLWLMVHQRAHLSAARSRPSPWLLWPLLVAALSLYVFGRAFDLISIEAAGLFGTFLASMYFLFGAKAIVHNLFPFVYLGFLIPPPGWLIDVLTAPLRELVSFVSTGSLSYLGYPISREGITITIAQYQLLVEDACAGMNSLFGLIAISLFYIFILHRASWKHSFILVTAIIPVAVIANILRVVTLVLLTYYQGDAVAQGFLHATAGIALFAVALFFIFALDMLLRRFGTARSTANDAA